MSTASPDLLPAPPSPVVGARPRASREPRLVVPRRTGDPLVVGAVHLLCLGLVLLGARAEFLRNSIRLDEAQSLWQTNHSYGSLLRIIAEDVHVPLYHVLLRTWRLVLGPDIQTARLLSLLFLLAAVPVFYLVARKVLSTPWALFALVVFSCSPFDYHHIPNKQPGKCISLPESQGRSSILWIACVCNFCFYDFADASRRLLE